MWKQWRNYLWDSAIARVVLEVRIPKEILKPIKAMEYVFSGFFGVLHDPPSSFHQTWIEGQIMLRMALEIVSLDGQIHFFLRVPEPLKEQIEAVVHSQYPEAEVFEVEDYTKNVPQNIPNEEWDLFGAALTVVQDESYPIRTYPKFETEVQPKEEKRIDPISTLLEGLSRLGSGEQAWLQIVIKPVLHDDNPWRDKTQKIVNKLAKRPEPKYKSIIDYTLEFLNPTVTEKKEAHRESMPEMQLTPGEKEIVRSIEEKMAKETFETFITFIYLGKRDVFDKPKGVRCVTSFIHEFATANLNALKFLKKTVTKLFILPNQLLRRIYVKKRHLFRQYTKRLAYFFPRVQCEKKNAIFILNTEELASLYHFPGRMVTSAPAVSRVEVKKGEAPSELPIE